MRPINDVLRELPIAYQLMTMIDKHHIKSNQIYFSVAENNNTQYKSRPIHLRI